MSPDPLATQLLGARQRCHEIHLAQWQEESTDSEWPLPDPHGKFNSSDSPPQLAGVIALFEIENIHFFDYGLCELEKQCDWMHALLRQRFLQEFRNHLWDLADEGDERFTGDLAEEITNTHASELLLLDSRHHTLEALTESEFSNARAALINNDILLFIKSTQLKVQDPLFEWLDKTQGILLDTAGECGIEEPITADSSSHRGPVCHVVFAALLEEKECCEAFHIAYDEDHDTFRNQVTEFINIEIDTPVEIQMYIRKTDDVKIMIDSPEAFQEHVTRANGEAFLFAIDKRLPRDKAIALCETQFKSLITSD